MSLTPAEKQQAQAVFAEAEQAAVTSANQSGEDALRGLIPLGGPCRWCGGLHKRACNRVRRLEWHANGNLLVVEFWPSSSWDQAGIIWPEDAFDPEDS